MKEFFSKLGSRKLIVAVGSALVFIATEQYEAALAVVLAYLGVQGVADTTTLYAEKKYQPTARPETSINVSTTDNDEVDTSRVISGSEL